MSISSKVILTELSRIVPAERITADAPMKDHTTFRVGGSAAALVLAENVSELRQLLSLFRDYDMPYMILGNGSNILVSDEGYRGVAVKLAGDFDKTIMDGETVRAGAGVSLTGLASAVQRAGLSGLEFAYGIPGTLGGAMVMNAGAYGGEMKDITVSVTVMDDAGAVKSLSAAEMAFGYRDSIVKHRPFTVLDAKLKLSRGNSEEILKTMQEHMEARRSKQPLEYPSAGSTFKRPEGYFAGKLIQEAGLSGKTLGGAQVSEKHCGFVINKGEASASDISALMELVQSEVLKNSGVRLEPEVIKVGKF